MKTLRYTIVLLSAFYAALCTADTWTAATGETLEAEFVDYNANTGTITIKRAADGNIFSIPETDLIISDQLKAVRLKNKDIPDYWYTDYAKAKSLNPDNRGLILYRNNAKPEHFELFCAKLLLRESFVRLLKSRGVIVCIAETVPDELAMARYRNSENIDSKGRRIEQGMPRRPVAFIVDFAAENRMNDRIFRAQINLYQPPEDPNPFLEPPENPQYIALEEIERYIRRFKRP